eukprot:TRINITY_DN9401_c0_g1_i1.p2 TRINITY_DN9401_c0_g1~~TRINITY_DN9401_c0_g1_i1.p2  ORF type:complete len:111 (-),score=18.13 TRINITY_DN9401_c0_g1_i1:29-361(-)
MLHFVFLCFVLFFFFKQKTAYEIMPSLVGSEMCIRDSITPFPFFTSQFLFFSLSFFIIPLLFPVSYTHLTLPTICSVQISVVAVSFKKKKYLTVGLIHHSSYNHNVGIYI